MAKLKSEEIKVSETAKTNKDVQLDEIEAKIEAMLKAAEEKAKKIIENAAEEAGSIKSRNNDSALSEEVKAEIERNEEYVDTKLFKDDDKYRDDVYVAVGNQNCVIKRGVPVRIKRKFLLALDESSKNDLLTAELIERESGAMKAIG